MPADGADLIVYDAGTGAELKRISRAHLADAHTLLAVSGDKIIAAGDTRVIGLDWKLYDRDKFTPRGGAIAWASPALTAPDAGSRIRGRGFVTRDSVFIPRGERLWRLDMKTGRVVEMYPRDPQTWQEGEGPGNVIVTQDHVILASATRVSVYADLQLARAKLQREIAAAPADASPRLHYAEILFVAGCDPEALGKLDEAIGLLGGQTALAPGADRDRLFNDAVSFGLKLIDRRQARPDLDALINQFFDRAAIAAASPVQQVVYRLALARFASARHDAAAEVRAYQDILLRDPLRKVMLADDAGQNLRQAAALAEQAIAERIKASGPACYAPYEQAAAETMRQAGHDPDRLEAVARAYPNSQLADRAMIQAADACESAGDPRRAAQMLRQVYFKYPLAPSAPQVLEALARNYLAMPNRIDVAISRLNQGARLHNDPQLTKPLRLPDGQTLQGVSFSRAARRLRQYADRAAARSLPDFHLPPPLTDFEKKAGRKLPQPFIDPAGRTVASGVAAIVSPADELNRYDRLVTWSADSGISVYAAGAAASGSSHALDQPPAGAAWLGEKLLLWTADTLVLLRDEGRNPVWKIPLKSLPRVDLASAADRDRDVSQPTPQAAKPDAQVRRILIQGNGRLIIRGNGVIVRQLAIAPAPMPQQFAPDAPEQILQVRPVGDRIFLATSTGRVVCLDAASGKPAWQIRPSDYPVERLLATEDFVVLRLANDQSVQLVVLNAFDGQLISRRNFDRDSGLVPQNQALAADGTLVYTLPDRLCGKDLYEPGNQLSYEVPLDNPAAPFMDLTRPDQLVIADGRILALAGGDDNGGAFVRVHSLQTGQVLRYASLGENQPVDAVLGAESKDRNVSLRVAGPYLYALGQRTLVAYNLDHLDQNWRKLTDFIQTENFRDLFVGRDYVAVLDQPAAAAASMPACWLDGISRAKLKNDSDRETGLWLYKHKLSDPSGIVQVQPVEGGFYYLTADHKLHLLQGARDRK